MFSLALRGFALGFAVAASPGPIFFLCVRRTLVRGRLHGLLSGFGVATVDGFYAAVAVFGFAALSAAIAAQRKPLALVGALVLVALGVRILLEEVSIETAPTTNGRGLAMAYVSMVGLTITNPATIVSFAALAAALGLGTAGSWARPAVVVLGVLLGSAAWWCLLVVAAGTLRSRLTPRVVRGISVASGSAIALLGLVAAYAALG